MIPEFFRSRKQIRCWLFSKLGAQEMHWYVARNQGCQQRKLQRNKEDSSFLSRFSPKTQSVMVVASTKLILSPLLMPRLNFSFYQTEIDRLKRNLSFSEASSIGISPS